MPKNKVKKNNNKYEMSTEELKNLALHHEALGQWDEAVDCFSNYLKLCIDVSNPNLELAGSRAIFYCKYGHALLEHVRQMRSEGDNKSGKLDEGEDEDDGLEIADDQEGIGDDGEAGSSTSGSVAEVPAKNIEVVAGPSTQPDEPFEEKDEPEDGFNSEESYLKEAWEMLDLARVICARLSDPGSKLLVVKIRFLLSEVMAESYSFLDAYSEVTEGLEELVKLEDYETKYQILGTVGRLTAVAYILKTGHELKFEVAQTHLKEVVTTLTELALLVGPDGAKDIDCKKKWILEMLSELNCAKDDENQEKSEEMLATLAAKILISAGLDGKVGIISVQTVPVAEDTKNPEPQEELQPKQVAVEAPSTKATGETVIGFGDPPSGTSGVPAASNITHLLRRKNDVPAAGSSAAPRASSSHNSKNAVPVAGSSGTPGASSSDNSKRPSTEAPGDTMVVNPKLKCVRFKKVVD